MSAAFLLSPNERGDLLKSGLHRLGFFRSFLMAIDWSSDVAAGAAAGALLAFLLALVTSGRCAVVHAASGALAP